MQTHTERTHRHTYAHAQAHIIVAFGDTCRHLLVIPSHLGVGDGDDDHLLGSHPGGHHYALSHKSTFAMYPSIIWSASGR